jgi:hypothetical protein
LEGTRKYPTLFLFQRIAMIRKPFLIISIVALMALGRETLTAAETATPEEAKVLLNKAVAAVKKDKSKALAMFNTRAVWDPRSHRLPILTWHQ